MENEGATDHEWQKHDLQTVTEGSSCDEKAIRLRPF